MTNWTRLSDYTTPADIAAKLNAVFPGPHCPLFGACNIVPLIRDAYALVVAPNICLYNAKLQIKQRLLTEADVSDNILGLELNNSDTVFGAEKKLRDAIIHIDKTISPPLLLIVTTCTQEITGEDFDAIAQSLKDEVSMKLLVIHTDNFTCYNHMPGIERSLTVLAALVPQSTERYGVNLLGLRTSRSEVAKFLRDSGVQVNAVIPAAVGSLELAQLGRATHNIVFESTAAPLALELQQSCGQKPLQVPRSFVLNTIHRNYALLAEELGLSAAPVAVLEEAAKGEIAMLRGVLEGKKFAVGASPAGALSLTRFLSEECGMIPAFIQLSSQYPNDDQDIAWLLENGLNPYVLRSANLHETELAVEELKPDVYIGHADRRRMMALGTLLAPVDAAADQSGYAMCLVAARIIAGAFKPKGGH